MTRRGLFWAWGLVALLVALGGSPGEASAEAWPPPLPSAPWRATHPMVRGLSPAQPFRMDAVMKLTQALSPAVVQVEAILKKGSSQGSGFFLGPEGYLVTNNHVMSSATHARLTFSDGRTRSARLVARDPVTDFALLYAEARPGEQFDWLPLGDSDQVRVGQWAAALGAPLRFGNTVTVGVVSSVRRRGSRPRRPNWMKSYIQFDTAINPGSSGGVLVNMGGQVIGVVTAMRKDAQGLGFAVPVNRLKRMLPRMMGGYDVERATLGVAAQSTDEALARSLGLKSPTGALLRDVDLGGPADKAGLLAGDVIVRYDGQAIADHADLSWLVATSRVTEPVDVVVVRAREKLTVTVEPKLKSRWHVSSRRGGADRIPPGGVGVTGADAEVVRAMGFDGLPGGVLVYVVAPGSVAYRAGVRPGMWVVQVGDALVATPARFYQAVNESLARDGAVRVRVYNGEREARWMAWEAPAGD